MLLSKGEYTVAQVNELVSALLLKENQSVACNSSRAASAAQSFAVPFAAYLGNNRIAATVSYSALPSGVTLGANVAATTSADGLLTLNIASGATLGGTTMAFDAGIINITITTSYGSFIKKFSWTKTVEGLAGGTGNTGATGTSITLVDVEYYLSTSATALAGGSWSTTAPTWVNGKYMWSKVKTTYSSGSPTYTSPACIAGQQGNTGSTGTGITSITEEYYLSTSKTAQTGADWVETPPTWEINKYLWTRSKIIYNNPSSTVYTTPVCDNSWEATTYITPFINGTQAVTTGSWTGVAPFATLQHGQQITYRLPYPGTGNATLNLTLLGGSTTGAKDCYYMSTTRLTTHYAQGNVIRLTYLVNNRIGATDYTGWWSDASYTTGDTIDRIRHPQALKAKTAITAARLVVSDDGGYFHLAQGSAFDTTKNIFWAEAAVAAGATSTTFYSVYPTCSLLGNQSGVSLTSQKVIYIKGALTGKTFTVDATSPLFTDNPTESDCVYMAIGQLYSTSSIILWGQHEMYRNIDGVFKSFAQIAYDTQVYLS